MELTSRLRVSQLAPIALGLVFWIVVAATWFSFFRRPDNFDRGSILAVLDVFAGGLVPAWMGTFVGVAMSIRELEKTNGRSWFARVGLLLCGSASVFVAAIFLWLALC